MEIKEQPKDKLFYPGLLRANGRIWIAEPQDATSRPEFLIDYAKLTEAVGKLIKLEGIEEERRILDALEYLHNNEATHDRSLKELIEKLIEKIDDIDDIKPLLEGCICRDQSLIDKYMQLLKDRESNDKPQKLFRLNQPLLVDALETTVAVDGLADITQILDMLKMGCSNVRIIDEPIKDPRLPSEWGGVNYRVLADTETEKGQCVGMSNFYETAQ